MYVFSPEELSEMLLTGIKHKFSIKTPRLIERIKLNTTAQAALVYMPYMDYELAYQIVEIRLLK